MFAHVFDIAGKISLFYAIWFVVCKVYWVLSGRKVGSIHQRKFRDGRTFAAIEGDLSVSLVHKEIYCDKCYFRHGVTLDGRKNPLVVDIGGNCGLFTSWVCENYPTAVVQLIEPAPTLIDVCHKNLAKFGVHIIRNEEDAKKKAPAGTRVTVHRAAIGAEECEVDFTFEPLTTAGSSMKPDAMEPQKMDITAVVRALLYDAVEGEIIPYTPTRQVCALMTIPYLRHLVFVMIIPFLIMIFVYFASAGAKKEVFKCTVKPLSSILDQQQLTGKKIDMMKIDVEGAEWEVLQGLSDANWRDIDQMVVEVHDGKQGRIAQVKQLLKERGFINIHEEDEDLELHKIVKLSTIFATR